MNPYQPPVQYPSLQNAYPVPPQDPQSKYPQLPHANPFQNVPPQYPYYPQQQPQIPYENRQGYIPQSQHTLVGANPNISESRILLKKEIQDVETLLEKDFCLYKIWLGLMIFFGVLTTGYALLALWAVCFFRFPGAAPTSSFIYVFIICAPIFGIWLIMQCLSQRKAIEKKDLAEAKKALNYIYWVAFFYLGVVISFFVNDAQRTNYLDPNYLQIYLIPFILFYVIPVCIHIAGARKVGNLLEKRDALALELDTRSANNV